jgi:mono/diheme cytochrome c family protein
MKQFFLGVIATLAVLAIGVFGYLRLGLAEVRADLPPPSWENYLVGAAVHAAVRREAPEVPNPVEPTDENLIAGGKMYLAGCAGCHGTPGKPEGDGGAILYPRIPELPVVGTEYSEAQIYFVIKHGVRRSGMFANGNWMKDKEMWTVAAYIKRMKALPAHVQEELAKKPASGQ